MCVKGAPGILSLQWRHNERDGSQILGVSIVCWTASSGVTGHCEGNSPVTGEISAQKTSDAGNVSIWWHHHVMIHIIHADLPLFATLEQTSFRYITDKILEVVTYYCGVCALCHIKLSSVIMHRTAILYIYTKLCLETFITLWNGINIQKYKQPSWVCNEIYSGVWIS